MYHNVFTGARGEGAYAPYPVEGILRSGAECTHVIGHTVVARPRLTRRHFHRYRANASVKGSQTFAKIDLQNILPLFVFVPLVFGNTCELSSPYSQYILTSSRQLNQIAAFNFLQATI